MPNGGGSGQDTNRSSSGARAAKLKQVDEAAAAQNPNEGASSTTQGCTAAIPKEVIEVLVVGEDDKPVQGIPVALRQDDNMELADVANAEGIVRFECLEKKKYKLCLYKHHEDAWEVKASEALESDKSSGTRKAAWAGITTKGKQEAGTHTVQEGECIVSLAEKYGFLPETIWEYNTSLKEKRENLAILMEGDKVEIPVLRQREEEVETGKRYTLKRKGVPTTLRIRFLDYEEKPRRNVPYILKITAMSGRVYPDKKGNTNDEGFLIEGIPSDAKDGEIMLGTGDEQGKVYITLGSLEPISEMQGIQHRLSNLGYLRNAEENPTEEEILGALAVYQVVHGLEDANEAIEELRRLHLS